MATGKDYSFDLSANERSLIFVALELKAASLLRAVKAATSEAVRDAYNQEYQSVVALQAKFR